MTDAQAPAPDPSAPAARAAAPSPDQLVRVVALDGPAGSGKTTVAARTARALGWRFVDTGATYRAATLAVLRAGTALHDQEAVTQTVVAVAIELGTDPDGASQVLLDGEDVSSEIRGAAVTAAVSAVSAVPGVRQHLIELQRRCIGLQGAVVEGRDIATVVAPHAALKVYLDARPEVRAARRSAQTLPPARDGGRAAMPESVGSAEVQTSLERRDALDGQTNRLEPSDGAIHLDTSDLTLDEVVAAVVSLAGDAGLTGTAQGSSGARRRDNGPASSPPGPPGARDRRWTRTTGRRRERLIRVARPFGWVLFHTVFRVRVLGREHVPPTGPVLLAGNHTGFLDGPLAFALTPRSATFLAKSELFVGPIGRALGWLGQIPVHRGRPDRAALRAARRVLAGGGAVGIFPEGTRGAGTLQEVAHGVAYLAVKTRAPLVPVAVLGTFEAMPKGARLPRWRAPVSLVFGPAFTISVEGDPRSRRTVAEAAEQIRLTLVAHVQSASVEHHLHDAAAHTERHPAVPEPKEPPQT